MFTTAWCSPGTVTGTGWSPDSGTLVTALASSDNVRVSHAATVSDFLSARNYGLNVPAGGIVTQIEIEHEGQTGVLEIPGDNPTFGYFLTKNGAAAFGSEKTVGATPGSADNTPTVITFPGLAVTAAEANNANFGCLVKRGSDTTGTEVARRIDRIRMRATYVLPAPSSNDLGLEIEPVDLRYLMEKGGLKSLGGEALPSLVAAATLCPNIPALTRIAMITVRTADITIRLDNTDPTAGANGIDIKAGSNPLFLPMTKDQLSKVKGIQSGGVATGWVEYFTLP